MVFCCKSIEKLLTCPNRKLPNALPVCPASRLLVVALPGCVPTVLGGPREFETGAVKLNRPVGEGGCNTFKRSTRKSTPNFNECRLRCQPTASKTCVISVLKSESVLVEGPSCWKPAMVKVG